MTNYNHAEMTAKEIKAAIRKLPYFSKDNVGEDLYPLFLETRNRLTKRSETGTYPLNKGAVTGIWCLTHYGYDKEHPFVSLVIRYGKEVDAEEKRAILLEMQKVFPFNKAYETDKYILNEYKYIPKLTDELRREITLGHAAVIYDRERDC